MSSLENYAGMPSEILNKWDKIIVHSQELLIHGIFIAIHIRGGYVITSVSLSVQAINFNHLS